MAHTDGASRALEPRPPVRTATVAPGTFEEALHEIAHLKAGLAHRTVIGQATGLIMAQQRIGPDEAFAVLVQLSQDTNTKVYELACRMVHPDPAPGRPSRSPAELDRPQASGSSPSE